MILNEMKYGRLVHLTLLDPDKLSEDRADSILEIVNRSGTDGILVGGSTATDMESVDKAVKMIRYRTKKPIILFPSASTALSPNADAIFYLSLLNSADRDFIIGHQVKASRTVRNMKLEVIPIGYIIFEPGMTVGRVGRAMLLKRDDYETALSYALAAELMGFSAVYFEAGSGADKPIDPQIVKKIVPDLNIPIIVGGGIRDPETAREFVDAGAATIVTGTIAERDPLALEKIIKAIKAR